MISTEVLLVASQALHPAVNIYPRESSQQLYQTPFADEQSAVLQTGPSPHGS